MWRISFIFGLLSVCRLGSAEEFQKGLSSDEIFNVAMPDGANNMGGRTIDEVIRDAGTEKGAAFYAGQHQQVNVQYDMNLDPLQYELLYKNNSAFAGAALQNDYYRWPKGIIPYQISSAFRGRATEVIYAAMKEWQERTCLRFEPHGSAAAKESGHNHKVDIINSGGCFSMVGYSHRSHSLSLSLQGCIFHGTALHELGHTIGLNHEQCRNDRDKRIKVLFENVEPRYRYAFDIENGQTDFGIPYDYCSIMQYGPTAFSKNREFTVLAKDFDYQWSLGWHQFNAEGLMFSDAKVVNLMYKCNAHCPADASCKSPCYVNHKCQCECETRPCKKFSCESRTSKSKCDWYRNKYGVSGGGGGPLPPTEGPVVPPTKGPIVRPTKGPIVRPTKGPVVPPTEGPPSGGGLKSCLAAGPLVAHESDCSKYYQCTGRGAGVLGHCTPGLRFNPVIGNCDWASNVHC